MWDYCILSKLDAEQSSDELDKGDQMHLDNFEAWVEFIQCFNHCQLHLKTNYELFKYFVGRDMLLLPSKFLHTEEHTKIESENKMMQIK